MHRKLRICLYWHMHQPDYRDYLSGEFILPWTYLHAIKDYTDMAYHLEQNPQAKVTFNYVPVLLDQLEEYAKQLKSGKVSDPLLSLLAEKDLSKVTQQQRQLILESCFRGNHEKMIAPFPHYQRLFNIYQLFADDADDHTYLSGQYLADLITWYHLSWMGESIRRGSELVVRLMAQGGRFTAKDRKALFDLIGDIIIELIPRHRALSKAGRIEISTTPHYHPILPLLLDFNSAREAAPDMPLPDNKRYPGGMTRAHRHAESAIHSHQQRFGQKPNGVWPAEGGVSHAALMLLAKQGFGWAATGEGVLNNSLRKLHGEAGIYEDKRHLYRPYRVSDNHDEILCFFRDDRLSDKIGFEYAKWHGRDAVNDLVGELEGIMHRFPEGETPVVSIILDGENAWEYYPYNGYYFLSDLYQALAEHPCIEMSTFSEVAALCEQQGVAKINPGSLPSMVAGSWVYGTFSTWMGDSAKNRAWDLLCEAKQNYDLVVASGRLNKAEKEAAERQLGDCEGSDWFWWFGDYNPSGSVQSFDLLFRRNLSNLYRLLKLPAPADLAHVISRGNTASGDGAEAAGAMRRGQE
ncbi:MAG: glycoside hydrolase [Methylophilales bacterium]|nr:glycoside hydrolase [Methylophilales bacterium]